MSMLAATTFDVTNDKIIDVMTSGIVWDVPANRVISWALADGLNDMWEDRDEAIQQFGDALASIQAFIDIDFRYVGDFSSPILAGDAGADIVYTLDLQVDEPRMLASAFFPGPSIFNDITDYITEGGDVFLNFANDIIASSSFEPGSDGFLTLIHEISHALGLKHPFTSEFGRPSIPELNRTDILDVDWFTVMSYTDPFESELERWDPATPMLLDVLALQYLYGQNLSTNAGDTIHFLESFDYQYAIWDASGTDRVDVSGQAEGWYIELPNTYYASVVDTLAGFALPQAEYDGSLVSSIPRELVWLMGDLENVVGSSFGDEIRGNNLVNDLQGAAGNDSFFASSNNDVLNGGGGIDTAVYSGDQSSYTLQFSPTGTTIMDRRSSEDGTDTLIDIENLVFADGNFDLSIRAGAVDLSAEDFAAIAELYIAYFNRAPAAQGLLYWATRLEDGMTLPQIAESFFEQPETQRTYETYLNADGSLNDTEAFVRAVFNNVLGRDPSGPYWVNELDNNPAITPAIFILSVLEGARAETGGAGDVAYLQDKTDIGVYFSAIRGLSEFDDTVSVMGLYNGSAASVSAAVSAIDEIYGEALDPSNGEFLMPLVGVIDDPFAVV
ncbi:DUF4214 domain-containing protein [Marivita sp.]|uniref:DUF4214 domain-containing protein n=1 Tax=Marivita sp. TaxID=2003365 RepID=UPI0025C3D1CF|nr:DUF4214 domain-containing protein [Marivita sp.]